MALVQLAECMTTRGHIQGANRDEAIQCPLRLEEYIAADNPMRLLDAFVDARDRAALGLRHVVAVAPGRPRSQPGHLLQLYIDGYLDRVRASRHLAQETPRHVALLWLRKQLRPAHQPIAHVRRDHLLPL